MVSCIALSRANRGSSFDKRQNTVERRSNGWLITELPCCRRREDEGDVYPSHLAASATVSSGTRPLCPRATWREVTFYRVCEVEDRAKIPRANSLWARVLFD